MPNIVDVGKLLSIGRITLDCERHSLQIDGEVVPLRPQSFKVLRILIENRDKLVAREYLLRAVWQDRIVTDDSLVQCLVDVRRALAKIDRHAILTLPGRGYLFQSDLVASRKRALGGLLSVPRTLIAAGCVVLLVTTVVSLRFQASDSSSSDRAEVIHSADENFYAQSLIGQAMSELRLRNTESSIHAERLLRHALELEPDNVTALAVLALAVRRGGHEKGGDSVQAGWKHSIEITDRALALDPDHAFAIAQRAWAELYYFKDYVAAARSVERATSLDATDPEVMRLATNASMVFDKPEVAMRLGQLVLETDPLCIPCQTFLIVTASVSGNLELAEQTARRLLALNPEFLVAYKLLGDVLLSKGDPSAALSVLQQRNDESAGILFSKAIAHHRLGQFAEFARLRARLIELHSKSDMLQIARLEAYTGNIDDAFGWLDRHEELPLWVRGLGYHSQYFENLHDDPRWDNYLTEYGLSPRQLARIDFSPTLPL